MKEKLAIVSRYLFAKPQVYVTKPLPEFMLNKQHGVSLDNEEI